MRLCAKFRLDRFILSASGGEKLQILPFFGLRHSVVSPNGSSLRKLNTDAQLQTFPYPMVSKSFLYSNAFMAKQLRTNSDVQKRDGQTDKQTKKQKTQRFWPPRWRMKSEPYQTWHGNRGLQACSCTSKTFGIRRSFAGSGC